jgi:serine protease Do
MRNRKNIAFGSALLITALTLGAGASQWIEPNISWAADSYQSTEDPNAAALAEMVPSQALLADLYDQVEPSVVNIQVTATRVQAEPGVPGLPPELPFGLPDDQAPLQGQGSGFIYDNEGHIVTNNHVVEGATSVTVYFVNGMWAEGEVVATDPAADLAVIKVTPPEGVAWQPLSLAAADTLRVGYTVAAFGSPFGLAESMTVGVISAIDRSVPTGSGISGPNYSLPDVIQTDAAINPGNSGGPLVNLLGEVIGVNFAINSTSGSNSGIGFAIPVSVVRKVVPALIEQGGYRYSYLGVSGTTITANVAAEQNLEDNTLGVYVAEVVEGGPASEAGIQANDLIVAIDDQPISSFEELTSYLFQSTEPEQTVSLQVLRDGEPVTLDVTLQERPSLPVAQEDGVEAKVSITIAQAIEIAREAIGEAGLMGEIENANATIETVDGRAVWVVTLTSEGSTATVTVDGETGEVIALNME